MALDKKAVVHFPSVWHLVLGTCLYTKRERSHALTQGAYIPCLSPLASCYLHLQDEEAEMQRLPLWLTFNALTT